MLIQLFRDPRGVVNSRQRTHWYTYKGIKSMTEDVKCLCSRMYADYKSGLEFLEKYPGKFMFVVYEDLLSDLPNKLNQLYKKLGINTLDQDQLSHISDEFQDVLRLHNTGKTGKGEKRKDYTFWWRSSLTWATVQMVDNYCKDVYQAIGYKSYDNEQRLRDYSIRSVEVKDYLKI